MKTIISKLKINSQRLKVDFDALSEIGGTGDGGIHRPALSDSHLEARTWFRKRIVESDLEFRTDGAGNHSAFHDCGLNDAKTLLLGSHLDSVPSGGRFDGALGVVAALEVLRVINEENISLPFHLEAIDFTDEEGSLVDLLGSTAFSGKLSSSDLQNLKVERDEFHKRLERAGLKEDKLFDARRDQNTLAGYIELHIEQGNRLIDSGIQIGIVSSIAGYCSYNVTYLGRADHAGTTPFQDRQDASLGAAAFNLAARHIIMEEFPDCVVNVGNIELYPGTINIIPSRARVSLEFRAPEMRKFEDLEARLVEIAHVEAKKYGLGFETRLLTKLNPVPLDPFIQDVIVQAAQSLDLSYIPINSMAGHDGQVLADICPVGMIFIPSVDGISHSTKEFSRWDDCFNGANVLLHTVLTIATSI